MSASQIPHPKAQHSETAQHSKAAQRRLEGDILSLLHAFHRQEGRCVEEIRVVNAAMYEGGRCPAAVRVRLEESTAR